MPGRRRQENLRAAARIAPASWSLVRLFILNQPEKFLRGVWVGKQRDEESLCGESALVGTAGTRAAPGKILRPLRGDPGPAATSRCHPAALWRAGTARGSCGARRRHGKSHSRFRGGEETATKAAAPTETLSGIFMLAVKQCARASLVQRQPASKAFRVTWP